MQDDTFNDIYYEETIKLLRNLIMIPSTDPPGNEKEIACYIYNYLTKKGIECEIDEFMPNRSNILAYIRGKQNGLTLVFSAHMDTMPIGHNEWTHDPFRAVTVDNKIYGRGASDMKGGLASMIVAFVALKKSNFCPNGDLILALSCGENSSLFGAKEFLRKGKLKNANACLICEPSSVKLKNANVCSIYETSPMNMFIAEKGALWIKVKLYGKSGHSSTCNTSKYISNNVVTHANKYIEQFIKLKLNDIPHYLLGDTNFSINKLNAGTFVSLVPDYCEIEIDIRTLPGQTPDDIINKIKDSINIECDIEILDFKKPVESRFDNSFVQICKSELEKISGTVVPTGVSYYSDGAVICTELNIPMVIIGPGELGMTGQQDEWVYIDNVKKAAKLYYDIAIKYMA